MYQAAPFLEKGIKVIDLSADFRIKDDQIWEEWYGTKHGDLNNLEKSDNGLTELNLDLIKSGE